MARNQFDRQIQNLWDQFWDTTWYEKIIIGVVTPIIPSAFSAFLGALNAYFGFAVVSNLINLSSLSVGMIFANGALTGGLIVPLLLLSFPFLLGLSHLISGEDIHNFPAHLKMLGQYLNIILPIFAVAASALASLILSQPILPLMACYMAGVAMATIANLFTQYALTPHKQPENEQRYRFA